jgi:hypothetical protein
MSSRAAVAPTGPGRRVTVAVVASMVVAALVGADAAFGAVAQGRADCRVVEGATVRTDLQALPVTGGLVTGTAGTAEVHVPWDVAAQRLAEESPGGREVSLTAAEGVIVAESTSQALPVHVSLVPLVTRAGDLSLTPVGVTVAGREIPVALAQQFGDAGELLEPRVLPGGVAGGPDYAITSADVDEGGLTMAVRIPLGALAGTGGGQPCDTTG